MIGSRKTIEVALDWTSFWHDGQKTLCLNLLTHHGRATPLIWQSVDDKKLKGNQGHYEDQMLSKLKTVLPADVNVTLVADRGFASYRFFEFIDQVLGFNYVIRLKSSTTVISGKGTSKKASEWLQSSKRTLNIKKDQRYGLALAQTHIQSPERRDRLLLIVALAYVLFTLLGAAGEQLGFDRKLKVNTVKTRTHSLIRQGMFYYDFFRHFTEDEKNQLMTLFTSLLEQHGVWNEILCAI